MQKKILLVDDYQDYREAMKYLIELNGYRVLEADNGFEALKQVAKEHFDLILMDISMPIMDGITAIKVLRQHKPVRNTPIIAVTAHSAQFQTQVLEAGANEVFCKPLDLSEFEKFLCKYLK